VSTTIKTEHAGAKNGGGYWGERAEAKQLSKRKRRETDKREAQVEGDGERVSASVLAE
jgi:hypothetical protein